MLHCLFIIFEKENLDCGTDYDSTLLKNEEEA